MVMYKDENSKVKRKVTEKPIQTELHLKMKVLVLQVKMNLVIL